MKGGAAWKKASEKKELAKALAGKTKKKWGKRGKVRWGKTSRVDWNLYTV